MTRRTKAMITAGCTLLLLAAEASIFWHQDWRYGRPTPRPANWSEPAPGVNLAALPQIIELRNQSRGRPLLLHFFNPECPCSRFNLDHVRELARQYQNKVFVVAVLPSTTKDPAEVLRQERRIELPAISDFEGRLAAACGVYSTPQGVVLDSDGRMFFRGNYNLSRFCAATATEFVRLSIEALIRNSPAPVFPAAATVAYGCALNPNKPFTRGERQ